MFDSMGKEGFEPSRLSARDSKSRLSANSSTSPIVYHGDRNYKPEKDASQ